MFPHRRKGEDVMRVLIVDDEQAFAEEKFRGSKGMTFMLWPKKML